MEPIRKNLPAIKSSLVFIGILGAAIFLLIFWSSRILSMRKELKTLQVENVAFIARKDELSKIQSESNTEFVNVAVATLPQQEPALLAVSQLKKLSGENSIVLNNLTTTRLGQTPESIYIVRVDFDLEVPSSQAFWSFIDDISKSAPLLNIRSIEVSGQSGSEALVGTMGLETYWASLPTTLPSITQPIEKLTSDQMTFLEELMKFTKPDFSVIENIDEAGGANRSDPFELTL